MNFKLKKCYNYYRKECGKVKKKVFFSLILMMFLFFIVGCDVKKENVTPNKSTKSGPSVVIYFSATGTTKTVAERIAKASNSEIIEIIPKEKYTSADLDYNSDCRANREQNDSKSRPLIENTIDISKYDTIYLGYPIWWGTIPKIILTLLDTYDFTGKTIIPFCTSGSSGISGSVDDLRKYNSKLTINDGKRFSLSDSDEIIREFVGDNVNEDIKNIKVFINNTEYLINLEDNETAKKFTDFLPLELNMSELNGNEKYIYLDKKLPEKSANPGRINAGDVMLYGDNCLVIFYKSFDTTYSYTKIGHIDNLPDLGNGNITVKFER